MTISRVTLVRESTVVEKTTVDVDGADDEAAKVRALGRSADMDLIWEIDHTDQIGVAWVEGIEALAEGDEEI
jgi:hypothetical protein